MNAHSLAPCIGSNRLLLPVWIALMMFWCHAGSNAQNTVVTSAGELNGYHIPFSYDPLQQNDVIVQVSLNGQAPLPFIVDTGVCGLGLIVDTEAAARLKLIPDAQSKLTIVGAMQVRPASLSSVALVARGGSPRDENVTLTGFDKAFVGDLGMMKEAKSGSLNVAGLIGVEVFTRCAVQFDFAAHVITLYPGPHAPIQIQGATVLPMSQHTGENPYFVRMTLQEGITTELMVDTGAAETNIPIPVAQRLHPLATVSGGTGSVYGLSITPTLLLPAVQLGATTLTQVAVDSQSNTMPYSSLGIDLLSRFRVTLDFPNRQMVLQLRPDDAQQSHLAGYTGISLLRLGSDYVVEHVDAGSPAQRAGVRDGDFVTGIDGHMIAGLPEITARSLLNGFANTKAKLDVKRDGDQNVAVSFGRLSMFARPPIATDGLFLDVPAHKPMQVIGVIKGCVGEQAGLKRGDVILEFNGHPTTDISTDILGAEYVKPQLTLKVQRKDAIKPLLLTLTARSALKRSSGR